MNLANVEPLHLSIIVSALLVLITGIYCLIHSRNIIRMIIAIEVMMKAVTLLLAFSGWLMGRIDLVQSFIITMIVIEVVVAVVAAGIALSVYRHNDTLDIDQLDELKG